MRTAAEFFADVLGKRPDVGALAAIDFDTQPITVQIAQVQPVDRHLTGLPVDLDPRVALKLVEYEGVVAIWSGANIIVEGLEDITDISKKVTDYILTGVGGTKAIVINKAAIMGSLRGSIENGDPILLTLDYELFGAKSDNQFFVSLTDPLFDARELSLVALNALQKLIDEVLKAVPKVVRNKLDSVISTGISEVSKLVEGNVAQYQKTFEELNKRKADLQKIIDDYNSKHAARPWMHKFASSSTPTGPAAGGRQYAALAAGSDAPEAQTAAAPAANKGADKKATLKQFALSPVTPVKLASQFADLGKRQKALDGKISAYQEGRYPGNFNFADKQPPSVVFENELLEIGHSGHCLSLKPGSNTIVQHPCMNDNAAMRWHATTPPHIVKAGAKTPEVDRSATIRLGRRDMRTTIAPSGYIHFVNSGACLSAEGNDTKLGVRLLMEPCDDHPRRNWKIVSNDGDYFQVINQHSGHCLHFADPNANPGVVEASWWPCNSSDQQALRIIPGTKPQYHKVDAILKSPMATRCMDVGGRDNKFHFPAKRVYQADCTGHDDQRWNYVETIDGHIKIINKKTGLCLYPSALNAGAPILEAACDAAHDMFWEKADVPGGFQIRNLRAKLCMGTPNGTLEDKAPIVLEPCNLGQNQVWDFGDKDFDFVWKKVRPHVKIPRITFSAGLVKPQETDLSESLAASKKKRPLHVCRAEIDAGLYPGQMFGASCQVAAGGKGDALFTFEVLTHVDKPHWRKVAGSDFPIGAIPAGRSGPDVAYICRVHLGGEPYIGAAIKGRCQYNLMGTQKTAAAFEVLTLH